MVIDQHLGGKLGTQLTDSLLSDSVDIGGFGQPAMFKHSIAHGEYHLTAKIYQRDPQCPTTAK